MVRTLRIIGGAGTGKTTELVRLMLLNIERGNCDPYSVGFVSFTRAARQEAAARAGAAFGERPEDLERMGWFRTLHSVCYRQLGAGKELLAETKADREWIEAATGESGAGRGDAETGTISRGTALGFALACWDVARATGEPLRDVVERQRFLGVESVAFIVSRYEQAKRLDGRCDFTDLLGRFAGVRFTAEGWEEATPEGDAPDLPVVLLDESQDQSALSDRVARRIVERATYAYVCGDPFQAVFGFAGSDSRHFMGWTVEDQRILGRSFRCPDRVLACGERILSRCGDYWDRGIAPRGAGGEVLLSDWRAAWDGDLLDPRKPTLLLARTNYQAARIRKRLDAAGIPWQPVDESNGGWRAPSRNTATKALYELETGSVVTPAEWIHVLKHLPAKLDGVELFAKGTKARFGEQARDPTELIDLTCVERWGGTAGLRERVAAGNWRHLIQHSDRYVAGLREYGWSVVSDPPVRVGTIHAAKGMEADDVLVLTTTSRIVEEGGDPDEERRLGYVAVTRARERCVLLTEGADCRMRELEGAA